MLFTCTPFWSLYRFYAKLNYRDCFLYVLIKCKTLSTKLPKIWSNLKKLHIFLTEFHSRGKYRISSLPWATFMNKNVVFLKLCMLLFKKIKIEKEKEVLRINLSKKWPWTNYCHRLRYRFRTDGKANGKLEKFAQNCFFCDNRNIEKIYVYVSNSRLVDIITEDPGYFNMLAKINKHDIIAMVRKITKKLSRWII